MKNHHIHSSEEQYSIVTHIHCGGKSNRWRQNRRDSSWPGAACCVSHHSCQAAHFSPTSWRFIRHPNSIYQTRTITYNVHFRSHYTFSSDLSSLGTRTRLRYRPHFTYSSDWSGLGSATRDACKGFCRSMKACQTHPARAFWCDVDCFIPDSFFRYMSI